MTSMRKYVRSPPPLPTAHPLIHTLFKEMDEQLCSMSLMADRAGVTRDTLRRWKIDRRPMLHELDACFHVLGMKLVARRGDPR